MFSKFFRKQKNKKPVKPDIQPDVRPALAPHPLSSFSQGNTYHVLHSFYEQPPEAALPWDLTESVPEDDDVSICKDLIEAYRFAEDYHREFQPEDYQIRGIWNYVRSTHHTDPISIVEAGDPQKLAVYLANGLRTPLSYGLFSMGHWQSQEIPVILRAGDAHTLEYGLLILDRFVRLAEAVGVLSHENPEQGLFGRNILTPIDELISDLEEHLGVNFDRPQIMGLFGFRSKGRLYDSKAPEDAYAAKRIHDMGATSVLEIGGGFGGVALQLSRYGIRTEMYDLPLVNVMQAFFLIKALGRDRVELFGEKRPDAVVRVFPWFAFFKKPAGTREFVDSDAKQIVFNRDSMAEFREEHARQYLREIKKRKLNYLSINQEAENASGDPGINQISVRSLAKSEGLKNVGRFPYWLRKGYVEEIFIIREDELKCPDLKAILNGPLKRL